MSGTFTSWGEEYTRIEARLRDTASPPADRAQRVTAALFAELERRLARLPEREQQIFRYEFFTTISAKATTFLTLIDVFEGKCHTPDEAVKMGDGYMSTALGA